jgi:cleavage and polyadenylation specificity factor subunit 3
MSHKHSSAGHKRAAGDVDAPIFERFDITPLGAGNEVGRSCLIMRYKGKVIMLDCGILPSFTGEQSLPYLREINPAEIDMVFITHFHLDHAASLPYFTEKMRGFRGRIFATHATIACMKLILQDYIRVSSISTEDPNALYSETDIENCITKIEAIDFKQRLHINGIHFMFFNAGHVLGAAMVMIEIAQIRILYTGDYSCEEDRHLMAAEVPLEYPPDILIVESTYGMQVHESKESRETRFLSAVTKILSRNGHVLIPVFALGRAQELLLLLEEHWASHPELHSVPIYHASKLAAKSLEVYRTYITHMNTRVQTFTLTNHNPWDFQFVKTIRGQEGYRDSGPCVVLASPGMLQSGFSRQLLEMWCEDPKNGVILAGYSVEGTLARKLESNPTEIEAMSTKMLKRRLQIERISFSAHADSLQTFSFIEALQPPCVVLVHGEKNEMKRLYTGLQRKFTNALGGRGPSNFQIFMPSNGATVSLKYREDRFMKTIGTLATRLFTQGSTLDGVLISKHFDLMLVAPSDVTNYTPVSTHAIQQKMHVPYRSSFELLKKFVGGMYEVEEVDLGAQSQDAASVSNAPATGNAGGANGKSRVLRMKDGSVTLTYNPPDRVVLTWNTSPTSDMIADSLIAIIAQASSSPAAVKVTSKASHDHKGKHVHEGSESEEGGRDKLWLRTLLDSNPSAAQDGMKAKRDLLLQSLSDQYNPQSLTYVGPDAGVIQKMSGIKCSEGKLDANIGFQVVVELTHLHQDQHDHHEFQTSIRYNVETKEMQVVASDTMVVAFPKVVSSIENTVKAIEELYTPIN